MKKHSSTWILLILTIAVVGYAYFFEFQKRKTDEESKEKEALILAVEKDKITRIEFTGRNAFEIKKEGDHWFLTRPVQDRADFVAVNTFLDSLLKEKSDMEIEDEKIDFSMYHLEQTTQSFTVGLNDGKNIVFHVGNEALEGKQYLRRDQENAVIVGSSAWKTFASKTMKEFRDTSLFRLNPESVQEILVESLNKNTKTKLVKKDGKWSLENASFELDERQIQSFASQISNMKAQEVVSEDKANLAQYGLQKPAVRLHVTLNGEKELLVISMSAEQKDKNAYVSVSQLKPIYKVFGAFAEGYAKTVTDFRNRETPFKFDVNAVQKIKIQTDLLKADLQKQNNEWKLEEKIDEKAKVTKEVDQAQVSLLLNRLSQMRVREFLGNNTAFPSQTTLQFFGENNELLFEAKIGEELKGKQQTRVSTNLVKENITVDDEAIKTLPIAGIVKEKVDAPR
ncbi:MAG: DUF4340 domain-containing protein [Bdellovibrionales bacterium]